MTDHANELRRYSRKIGRPAGDVPSVMLAAADEIERLSARLEATEEDRSNFLVEMGKLCAQCDTLRAKIEQMERQEPAGTLHDDGCFVWRETAPHQSNYAGWKMALYALPGAKGE